MNKIDDKDIHQTGYRDFEGNFRMGEPKITALNHGTDIFNVLNNIEVGQRDLADIISALPNLKGGISDTKKNEILAAFSKDNGIVDNLDIVDIDETKGLGDIKDKITKLLNDNYSNFEKILSDNEVVSIEKDIENIELSVESVSGDNDKNFTKEFKDSGDFKIQILDKIKDIKYRIQNTTNNKLFLIKEKLLEKLDKVLDKAVVIFELRCDIENLSKKTGSMNMDELKDIWKQAFPFSKRH